MPVKLIQYWNILQGRKAAFDTFFTQEFVPEIHKTGLMKIVASWHVVSGEGPYFIAEGVSDAIDQVESLIKDPAYFELRQKLFRHVADYSTKLLVTTGRVEPQPIQDEWGYKFNQHFNINPPDYYEFIAFEEREHIPGMEGFGLKMVGSWRVAVGATPYVVDECRAEDLATIGEMLQSPDYQKLTLKLINMVSSYGCKILVPSGHLND
jgi:hypothetical protein